MIELATSFVEASKASASGIAGSSLLGKSLQDQFNVDRRRMLAAGDEVFLMHVGGGKAMKQRQPRAGASEKTLDPLLVGTAGMVDEFDPAVAVAHDRRRCFELHWRARAIQSRDKLVPGRIEAQVFGLVNNTRAIVEPNDLHRMTVIVKIGQVAFDLVDFSRGRSGKKVALDCRPIGVQARDELA